VGHLVDLAKQVTAKARAMAADLARQLLHRPRSEG
jgi:hypothetical protein